MKAIKIISEAHRKCTENCASTGADAQIPAVWCQKEAEMTSGAEKHGNPRVTGANQTVSV